MLNKEIYSKLPELNRLVNNGVAEVSEEQTDATRQVLRYELETFVCDGQYKEGLQKILEGFLQQLDKRDEQRGVWISGFYGSGKSHMAKMLRNLWTDTEFPDGVTARNLAKLPSSISDALKELTIQSKKHGGLHAAAGKLGAGAGDKVRLALMSIIFKSRGLPESFPQAQLVMYLRQEGIESAVRQSLTDIGSSLEKELPKMYVSNRLAKAVLSAKPSFASDEMAARNFITATFPQKTDITNDEMTQAMRDVLEVDGRFPLTLIVLDEVQQYIGNDGQKAYQVQEVTETLSKHFMGTVLFVATGQSALSGSANLMRLMGRFQLQIVLGDWDVENVTRQIILGKKPTAIKDIDQVWQANLGEISRHLSGTKLEHVTDDEQFMTADYPVLPVRRRFWERVLRTIDATGTVSQLRSQLRVVHEAVLSTADMELGHVVAGDFLYDQIAANLVSTGQLPKEIYENVQRFAAAGGIGELKSRLLKLIYLINKLPADTALEIGLRATESALADLLVMDLKQGSAAIRSQLPAALIELQDKDSIVMAIASSQGTEYRLQTRESSAWYETYRAQEAKLKSSPQEVEMQRTELFRERFRQVVNRIRPVQGKSAESRPLQLSFDETLPSSHAKALTLWVQDGWQSDERSVLAEARAKGSDCPTIFVYLPDQDKTALSAALMSLKAATTTISSRGTPSTEEGRDALRSMESRQRNAEKEIDSIITNLFNSAQVFQSGGQLVADGSSLSEKITEAAKISIVRLYREFDVSDHAGWAKVLLDAQKGNVDALAAVGHKLEPTSQPVCQQILSFVGPDKKGSEIRDNFVAAPYGWSRDAIDGAVFALMVTGHLNASDASGRALDCRSLDRAKLTQAKFKQESVTLSTVEKVALRSLFSKLGVPCQPNEELIKGPLVLLKLREAVQAASGPAPAPAAIVSPELALIEGLNGNAQLSAMCAQQAALLTLYSSCQAISVKMQQRQSLWGQINALLHHARDLAPFDEIKAQRDSINDQRALIAEPDLLKPVVDGLTALLRGALSTSLKSYQAAGAQLQQDLKADPQWQKLSASQQDALMKSYQADLLPMPDVSSTDALIDALEDCDLSRWAERTQALRAKLEGLLLEAAKLLQPKLIRVVLTKRTLENEADVKAWLQEAEKALLEELQQGPVIPG